MSKKRKSFILHYDSLNVLDDLTNEQAGLLFKAIKAYHLNDDITLDAITNIAMSPFKNQFERDAEKYEKLCEKNRLIAESRYTTKSTTGKSGNQTLPKATKSTDNDSKSDSDSDSDSKKEVTKDIVANAPKFSQDDHDCAVWMLSKIRELNPKFKMPNLDTWADDIRKIINIDKRTYQEISDLFLWVNNDDFWSSNILSPAKLRKQWDKIYMKSKSTGQNRATGKTQGNLSECEAFING